jgi:hypothetical protein
VNINAMFSFPGLLLGATPTPPASPPMPSPTRAGDDRRSEAIAIDRPLVLASVAEATDAHPFVSYHSQCLFGRPQDIARRYRTMPDILFAVCAEYRREPAKPQKSILRLTDLARIMEGG